MDLVGRQKFTHKVLGHDFDNAALTDFFNYLEAVALEVPLPEDEEEYDTRISDEVVLGSALEQIEAFLAVLPEDFEKKKAARK
jgi:hypothetical protein